MYLTNNDPEISDSRACAANATDAGAPANEIEITTEMIEVGRGILWSFNREFDFAEDYVAEIYRAMEAEKMRCERD